jgi:hypothetical protein
LQKKKWKIDTRVKCAKVKVGRYVDKMTTYIRAYIIPGVPSITKHTTFASVSIFSFFFCYHLHRGQRQFGWKFKTPLHLAFQRGGGELKRVSTRQNITYISFICVAFNTRGGGGAESYENLSPLLCMPPTATRTPFCKLD